MRTINHLIEGNRRWAERISREHPTFFEQLVHQQSPRYLWIGCSDSRVSADQIVDVMPGEIFVHRNVGNVVVHTDLNCLSVLSYAVEFLKVDHIIVCGHYGCGGVKAALGGEDLGLISNWLRHIQDVAAVHRKQLEQLSSQEQQANRLCELNVIEQAINVCQTTVVENAWKRGQCLTVHAWIYSISDGLIRDLGMSISKEEDIADVYQRVVGGG